MPKFQVTVTKTTTEYWEVNAENEEQAEENFQEGELTDEMVIVHQAEFADEVENKK